MLCDFAASDRRILITEDKDFGQLVFAAARAHSGVGYMRFPVAVRDSRKSSGCPAACGGVIY
jgi:Domain of unknown function (DUF5615)